MTRIITANVNGIRSAARKGFFQWMLSMQADFVCIQELKADLIDLPMAMTHPPSMPGEFSTGLIKGYSGVGIYSGKPFDFVQRWLPEKQSMTGYAKVDNIISDLIYRFNYEGRYIEYWMENLTVISVYLPSGAAGMERQMFKYGCMEHLYNRLKYLIHNGQEVVLCGDLNIVHQDIDVSGGQVNSTTSGCLPEERAWLNRLFNELGMVDVYRQLHPGIKGGYTWFSPFGLTWEQKQGWRIDYQIATPATAKKAVSAEVFMQTKFSDHAPLVIDYKD